VWLEQPESIAPFSAASSHNTPNTPALFCRLFSHPLPHTISPSLLSCLVSPESVRPARVVSSKHVFPSHLSPVSNHSSFIRNSSLVTEACGFHLSSPIRFASPPSSSPHCLAAAIARFFLPPTHPLFLSIFSCFFNPCFFKSIFISPFSYFMGYILSLWLVTVKAVVYQPLRLMVLGGDCS
jgi:hypothetical protein